MVVRYMLGLLMVCGVLLWWSAASGGPATSPAQTQPVTLGVPTVEQTPELTWPALKAFLDSPKGEVVLVDFWATWCPPCVAALPDLEKLAAKYKDQHLRVVLVSFDDPEDAPAVRDAITKAGVPFGSYLLKPADRAAVVKDMHPDWKNIVLPASFIFDRAGKQTYHRLFKTHTLAEWEAVVEPMTKAERSASAKPYPDSH